ncbi:MAG: hypothetical protein QMC96_11105 [Methanomicrobiales archaeon]|nr:hypothetical protein [Methanomicrobiales archaeon]
MIPRTAGISLTAMDLRGMNAGEIPADIAAFIARYLESADEHAPQRPAIPGRQA